MTDDALRKMATGPREFVRSCLGNAVHGAQKLILPNKQTTRHSIEVIASYGYGLYVLLALKCNMGIEYDPGKVAGSISRSQQKTRA